MAKAKKAKSKVKLKKDGTPKNSGGLRLNAKRPNKYTSEVVSRHISAPISAMDRILELIRLEKKKYEIKTPHF